MHEKIKVLIFSDQKDAITQISLTLRDSHFRIVGISPAFKQISTLLVHYVPEFLLVYLSDQCKDTNSFISKLKMISPRTRIIVIHKDCSSLNVFNAIKAGADVFLSNEVDLTKIDQVLTTIKNDDIYLPAFVGACLLEMASNESQATSNFPFILTDREKSILKCVARGMKLTAVADDLGISYEMVKAYTNNILQKIHFTDIAGKHYDEIIQDYRLFK